MQKLLIDTDAGVDDALAIAWLLTQKSYEIEVPGITIVAGNTTVDNAANNVLTVLNTMKRADIPVVVGAAKPFCRPLNRSSLLSHGPDGLWNASASPPYETDLLSHNLPRFYLEMAQEHPEATLLALGPLTNLALAVNQYPEAMRRFRQIIILGGTKFEGSMTPVAEFNFWQDPEAANVVLSADLPLTLMPREAFTTFSVTFSDLQALRARKTAVLKLLFEPLYRYISIQNQFGGVAAATLPDLVAAIYAADNSLGTAKPALVKIITSDGLVRGQSIMGFTLQERVTMILSDEEMDHLGVTAFDDPDFDIMAALQAIAAREPTNCHVVTDIQVDTMRSLFLEAMLG